MWDQAAGRSRSSPRTPGAAMTYLILRALRAEGHPVQRNVLNATTLRIPARLTAPEPGWVISADVIVVGSGIAGLTAALRLRQRVDRVLLVTKTVLAEGSTQWAQGGIAAALDPADSAEEHLADTLVAGAGVCDQEAVRILVSEGPARVRELATLGAQFDRGSDGEISLTREGGHGRDRIAHAGGDATGKEISRALIAALDAALVAVREDPGIDVLEHALVVDLLQDKDSRVCGVTLHVIGEGQMDGVGAARARLSSSPPAGSGRSTRPPRTRPWPPVTALRPLCGRVR